MLAIASRSGPVVARGVHVHQLLTYGYYIRCPLPGMHRVWMDECASAGSEAASMAGQIAGVLIVVTYFLAAVGVLAGPAGRRWISVLLFVPFISGPLALGLQVALAVRDHRRAAFTDVAARRARDAITVVAEWRIVGGGVGYGWVTTDGHEGSEVAYLPPGALSGDCTVVEAIKWMKLGRPLTIVVPDRANLEDLRVMLRTYSDVRVLNMRQTGSRYSDRAARASALATAALRATTR